MISLKQKAPIDLLQALGISELQPDEQEELLLDLGDLVFRGSMLRLIERMDEQTSDDFSKLLDGNPSEEAMTSFLTERVPDADKAVEEAIAELRNDILAVTS